MITQKYFLAKVQFITEDERSGKLKKVMVQYLVDAMSCTEAEARVVKYLDGVSNYEVKSVAESPVSAVIHVVSL
jgi:hypothetical protein